MRVRVSAQMGVMTETPDSPLLRKPQCQRGAAGHIGATSPREPPGTDENRQDLSRRSDRVRGVFAVVRNISAPDPAYRPTRRCSSKVQQPRRTASTSSDRCYFLNGTTAP